MQDYSTNILEAFSLFSKKSARQVFWWRGFVCGPVNNINQYVARYHNSANI